MTEFSENTPAATSNATAATEPVTSPSYGPTAVLVSLLALTALSAFIGEMSPYDQSFVPLVLLILVIKSQLIIDHFMKLKGCKLFWRLTMSLFSIVIAILIWSLS